MIQDNEIRAELVKYLVNEQSLDAFEDWLVQCSWNMHRDSSPRAQQLVSKIELVLAEFSNGHLSEEQVRKLLRPFVVRYSISVSYGSSSVIETSGISVSEVIPSQFADRSREVEFA